ncbi:MAG: hypothetical protein K9M57_02570 [Phycisphaerae bacterium]|nr:hypothetical protein [Phycisphaerae bacterium]
MKSCRNIITVLLLIFSTNVWAVDKTPDFDFGDRMRQSGSISSLRTAILDLSKTFGTKYPDAKKHLASLAEIEKELSTADHPAKQKLMTRLRNLQHKALLGNPLLTDQPIIFISRILYPYGGHHAIDTHHHTDENNNHKFKPGGALKVIHFGKDKQVKTLVEPKQGMVREPDVYFDSKKVAFALRKDKSEDYHIWELDVDPKTIMTAEPKKPRQLTCLKEVSDIDPIYLPDDSLVFTSTRERKYNMCSRDVAANLFRMDPDGANIYQITRNTLYDNHASLLPDGRILYARWEYVDRNFGDAHGIWTVNPDGTGQALYWSNNTACPGAVLNQRIIPGTQKMLCIFGPHHDYLWGSMAIVDRSKGMDLDRDHKTPILKMWPAEHIKIVGNGNYDTFGQNTFPRYCDPYPLSEKYFLCSKQTDKQKPVEMFLTDTFGNEIMIHSEQNIGRGCYNAMPLTPRKKPPVIPTRRTFAKDKGIVSLQDVYIGTHMKEVKRGSIKYLRIVESPPKQSWSGGSWDGQGYQAPGMNWHSFENKRILGTVPVEEDGSALFEVPCDKFIFFQALDENKMMIQSMRSGTILQSGENISCVGCHEDRMQAPAAFNSVSTAMKRAPSKLKGWYGPARNFSYMSQVQPVLTKNCVKCHDFGGKAKGNLILAADRNPFFNASYVDLWLWHKNRIKCIGGGPAQVQQAYAWGSHPSLLSQILRPMNGHEEARLSDRAKKLRKVHAKIKLNDEEMDRINTWLDLNGTYYPDYLTAYPNTISGRSPIDTNRLGTLTGVDFGKLRKNDRRQGPQVSIDRPELSPCLQNLSKGSRQYNDALAIIKEGAEQLKMKPRCDMDGFVPCEVDRRRLSRYGWYEGVAEQFKQAIRQGRKLYDRDITEWRFGD